MMKLIALFLSLIATGLQPHVPPHPPHLYAGRNGLTLVGLVQDGFVVAADGAQLNADGTTSEVQKLFPIGKTGAVVLAGKISTQDPVTRPVREEFNAARVVELWLKAHPDATFDTAKRELTSLISESANRFFTQRKPGRGAGAYNFTLLLLNYPDGKAALSGFRYFTPGIAGKPMRVERIESVPNRGDLWMFGLVKVPQEILAGSSTSFERIKGDTAVAKFRSAGIDQLPARDCAAVFELVVQAAETSEGRKFDPGRAIIAPPNRIATITASGFSFATR
jgi:hypothetical protein